MANSNCSLVKNPAKNFSHHNNKEYSHSLSTIPTHCPQSPLTVHNSTLSPVTECTYLGVTIDSTLTMASHIRNVCRNAFFHLHRIGKIRRYLDAPTTKLLVHAFVLSRLDYCNASFAGLPNSTLDKMQRVLNCSARLVLRARRREHTTRHLRYLNWLPINRRIEFKLAMHAYRCLCHCKDRPLPPCCSSYPAPLYLSSLLHYYIPKRTLRSSNCFKLSVPPSKTMTHGDRAFSRACPTVWNSLPESVISSPNISSFRSRLKKHLLDLSYPQ